MATTEAPKFKNSDLIPIPQPPDYHPTTTVSPTHDGLHFYQFMIAGSIAGMVEHMAMFPIDTIKTRMQVLGSCPIKSAGLRQAIHSILKSDGPAGFYRGIAAMGLGAGPAHAVYFSMYELCKETFTNPNNNNSYHNSIGHAGAGVCATVMSDAFYASYRTTILMNAPFTAVHFATYEAAKRGLMGVSEESVSDERLVVHATAGAVAGALAAAVTTPLDVVKTQLQCQGVCGCDRYANGSIKDVLKTIVKKDGYRGLFRGWMPRMLFHAPAAAICWSTYEAGKSFFQELNNENDRS